MRLRWPKVEPETQFLVLAAAVGAAGALGNEAFRSAIHFSHRVFHGRTQDLLVNFGRGRDLLLVVLIPILGGLAVGLLNRLAREHVGGYGMPSFLEAVNLKTAQISFRNTLLRTLAAVITLGSGGSAGVEGPMASLGGALGALVARARRIVGEKLRVLVACGSSAAIAAAYGAPIAGVFFTQEIVLAGNYDLANFVRVVVASGTATVVSRALRGDSAAFEVEPFELVSISEVGFYLALGLWCGVLGAFFSRLFYWVQARFDASTISPVIKPAAGGAIVGVIALFAPGVLGAGDEVIQELVRTQPYVEGWALLSLALLIVAKMAATATTIGSGGAGGVFGPSLFLGAALGAAIGSMAHYFAPGHAGQPGHYAMVGMGALLAATARAPLTAIFLVFEMTGSSSTAVLPTLLAVAAALYTARRIEPLSIDEMGLSRRGIVLKEGREASTLSSITAQQAMRPGYERLAASLPVQQVVALVSQSRSNAFVVVDDDELMIGLLSVQDLRGLDQRMADDVGQLAIASDLCERDVITVFPDESLTDALARLDQHGYRQLPVVSRAEPRRVLGMLERRHILSAYQRALASQGDEDETA
jgi:chloride channel protein, CIC family